MPRHPFLGVFFVFVLIIHFDFWLDDEDSEEARTGHCLLLTRGPEAVAAARICRLLRWHWRSFVTPRGVVPGELGGLAKSDSCPILFSLISPPVSQPCRFCVEG